MTDPKTTEDQELSLDQLKDAAGGISADARGKTTGTSAAFNVIGYPGSGHDLAREDDPMLMPKGTRGENLGSGVPVETFTPEDKQK